MMGAEMDNSDLQESAAIADSLNTQITHCITSHGSTAGCEVQLVSRKPTRCSTHNGDQPLQGLSCLDESILHTLQTAANRDSRHAQGDLIIDGGAEDHCTEKLLDLETLPCIVMDHHQNMVTYVSPGFLALSGFAEADLVGRDLRQLQGPATCSEQLQKIRDCVRNERDADDIYLTNYRKDGTPFRFRLALAPSRDHRRRVSHYIGIHTAMPID
jgi:PAS domain S-box-containing protein